MEKNKKSIVIGVTSLLLVTLILLGLTYAYYKTKIVGNTNDKSVSVTSKNLSVTYQNESAVINAEGIEPGYTATKTFEVTNTGSEKVSYSVMLDNVDLGSFDEKYTRPQDWSYTISENGTELKSGTLPTSDSYILYSESIDAGATKKYTFVLNYANLEDVDQSEDMGKMLSFRINISDSLGTTLTSATEGTLLYALNRDNVVSEPLTTPGRSISDEAVLASTEDDYGTSYYFRGTVENNYVNYSGMCWRIVRVQGDGNIKLALADENGECNADTYSASNASSAFVNGEHDNTYSGTMYVGYTIDLFEDSPILPILNNWVKSKNLDTSKLVDAEWCNDTAKIKEEIYEHEETHEDPDTHEDLLYKFKDYYMDYGASNRLENLSSANPTLKCNTKGMEGTTGIEAASQKYVGKIALLTADEVAFAGATTGDYSTYKYYYLQTNASGYCYWTMTPSSLHTSTTNGEDNYQISDVYTVGDCYTEKNAANLVSFNSYPYDGSVRPSIVLASNVTISSGDGTQTNPYVIS